MTMKKIMKMMTLIMMTLITMMCLKLRMFALYLRHMRANGLVVWENNNEPKHFYNDDENNDNDECCNQNEPKILPIANFLLTTLWFDHCTTTVKFNASI